MIRYTRFVSLLAAGMAFAGAAASLPAAASSDLLQRAELFSRAAKSGFAAPLCRSLGIDARSARAVERARAQFVRAASADASRRRRDASESDLRRDRTRKSAA